MRSPHRPYLTAFLAAAVALTLNGCGSGVPPATSADTPPAAVASSDSASASRGYSGTLIPFTFPGRPLSFQYPLEWHAGYSEGAGMPSLSGTATVSDPQSTKHLTVYFGRKADGAGNPVNRTVFESQPVPGLSGQLAGAVHYSFYVDRVNGKPTYRMHLTDGEPPAGDSTALDGSIRVGEDVLVVEVDFSKSAFAGDTAAKAWLAGAEGQAFKDLLLSMSYR